MPLSDEIEELSVVLEDLLNSSYQTVQDSLNRVDALTQPSTELGQLLATTLPDVDFQAWYADQKASTGSMVGSGTITWPFGRELRLHMQLELFRHLARDKPGVIGFSFDFLWVTNDYNANVSAFLDQYARPFARDLVRHIERHTQPSQLAMPNLPPATAPRPDARKVFVVHGRDGELRAAVFGFLRSLGLDPIEWSQAVAMTGQGSPYIGDVLDTAFGVAQAVVVLLTPDDEVRLSPELWSSSEEQTEQTILLQPRPNVLFEAGMAFGWKPDRTILVEIGSPKRFSDVAGRHTVRLDDSAPRRKDLADRLASAGCAVNTGGSDWLTAGRLAVTRSAAAPPAPSAVPSTSLAPSVKYVDVNYPSDVGITARLSSEGCRSQWFLDGRVARALDIDGWLVYQHREGERDVILKLRDIPDDHTFLYHRP